MSCGPPGPPQMAAPSSSIWSISTSCISSVRLPAFLFEIRGASTGARPVSAGWDLHESSCFTCSLLLPTPLTCLTGTMCKGRQGVALQHQAKRRLFQSQHNNPVAQILWKLCHWLMISGYIGTEFAAYRGMRVSCAVSEGKESKERFEPKPRNCLWGTASHFDWMMVKWFFYIQRIQVEPKNPLGLYTFFLQTQEPGQDGEQFALGAHTEGAALPSLLPSVSPAAMPMLQKKSHHNPNLSCCSDSSNNEELVKVLNWVLFYFVGENWGMLFFFQLRLLWLVLFHFWCQIRRNF